MSKIKVNKKVMELLEKFKHSELTEKSFNAETKDMSDKDIASFWSQVIEQKVNREVNSLVGKINEILEYINRKGVLDDCVLLTVALYPYSHEGSSNIGLLISIATLIENSLGLAVNDNAELLEVVNNLKKNWLWNKVFRYSITKYFLKIGLTDKITSLIESINSLEEVQVCCSSYGMVDDIVIF